MVRHQEWHPLRKEGLDYVGVQRSEIFPKRKGQEQSKTFNILLIIRD